MVRYSIQIIKTILSEASGGVPGPGPVPSGMTWIPTTAILYKDGAQYYAKQADETAITNSNNAFTTIQAALDYIDSVGGGKLSVLEGVYPITSDVTVPSGETYIIEGMGPPDLLASPTTSGGSMWMLEDGARFIGTGGCSLITRQMGFGTATGDTWTDMAFDFFGAGPATSMLWNSYNCGYSVKGIHPAGSSNNPWDVPTSAVIGVGSTSGPTGLPFIWDGNRFYDAREDDGGGTNDDNVLFMAQIESLMLSNTYYSVQIPAALTTPRMMALNPVSWVYIKNFVLYPDNPVSTGTYDYQFMTVGGAKNLLLHNVQLLDTNGYDTAHFFHHGGGTCYIYGQNVFKGEGGDDPVLPTGDIDNGGVLAFRLDGRGWENGGEAEASDTDTIAHGLLGDPPIVSGTVKETDSDYALNFTSDATNLTVSLYDIVAGAAETVDKTISWYGRYQFDVDT